MKIVQEVLVYDDDSVRGREWIRELNFPPAFDCKAENVFDRIYALIKLT